MSLYLNLIKVGGLLIGSGVLGLLNFWINPHEPAWGENDLIAGEISPADASSSKVRILWVDARSSMDYEAGNISSAILLNEDNWDELLPPFLSAWQPDMRVIVYCSSQKCQASHEVAKRLRSEVGLSDVYVLKGGWEAWLKQSE